MSKEVPVLLSDGITIMVEVDEPKGRGLRPISRDDEDKVARKFSDYLPSVQSIASSIIDTLQALPHKPETIAVEFGLKISGEAGIILTKGSTEANLKLSLTWKADKS